MAAQRLAVLELISALFANEISAFAAVIGWRMIRAEGDRKARSRTSGPASRSSVMGAPPTVRLAVTAELDVFSSTATSPARLASSP